MRCAIRASIYRSVYLIYQGNKLTLVSATTFEMAYLKEYSVENDLKIAFVRLNKAKMKNKDSPVTAFSSYLKNNELTFSVGRIIKKNRDTRGRDNVQKILIVLFLIQIAGILLLGTYV